MLMTSLILGQRERTSFRGRPSRQQKCWAWGWGGGGPNAEENQGDQMVREGAKATPFLGHHHLVYDQPHTEQVRQQAGSDDIVCQRGKANGKGKNTFAKVGLGRRQSTFPV